jgi:hypothetical protein
MVGPLGPRRRRSGTPAKRRPWLRSTPGASQPRPTPPHPLPSGPMRAGDHAAHRPRRHINRLDQPGRPATPSHSGVQRADSRACPSGHLEARTPGHRTPGHRTPGRWTSARPVGRTSPRRDRTRRTGQRPAWPASGHPRDRQHPLDGPTSPRSRRLGALGHPGRRRGDGTCAAALTTAATGQLPTTTRHQAAPRRTAVLM